MAAELAGQPLRPEMIETFADDTFRARLSKISDAQASCSGADGFAKAWNGSWPPDSQPDSRRAWLKTILISEIAACWSTTVRVEREADTGHPARSRLPNGALALRVERQRRAETLCARR